MEHHTDLEDAVWICTPDQVGPNPPRQEVSAIRAAYFRQSFELPAGCTLLVSVSASSRYRLWVNGRHAACGPCKGDRWTHYYERVDVSPYLRAGCNVIAARVVAYPPREAHGRTAWGPVWAVAGAAAPCLILQGVCRDGAGRLAADVTTGRSA